MHIEKMKKCMRVPAPAHLLTRDIATFEVHPLAEVEQWLIKNNMLDVELIADNLQPSLGCYSFYFPNEQDAILFTSRWLSDNIEIDYPPSIVNLSSQDEEDELHEHEWTSKDAEEIINAYKLNANKQWEVDLLNWILDRVLCYEDLRNS